MVSMHRALVLALALLLAAVTAAPARAEDPPAPAAPGEEPAPAPRPDPDVPSWSIEFLMPDDEDPVEGWEAKRRAPAGAPSQDGLYELAEALDLGDDVFYVETGALAKGDDAVGFAMVDVDRDVWAFRDRLAAQASAKGWVVRELGSPARVLVVGGAAGLRKQAADALVDHVVYRMADLGMNRLSGASGQEKRGREVALMYAEAIRGIAPKAGVPHAIEGVAHWIVSRPKKRGEEPDRAVEDLAVASFGKALEDGVPYPPKGSVRVFAAGQLGSILLGRKDEDRLAEATRALEIAVEHEAEGKSNARRFGSRYDLACAYARAGRIDKAFAMLEKAMQTGKSLPPAAWKQHFEHLSAKDPDLAPLRKDPRWKPLLEEHGPEQEGKDGKEEKDA